MCFCRFAMNSEVNLKSALLNMGLGDIFNLATADFTHITSRLTSTWNPSKLFYSSLVAFL